MMGVTTNHPDLAQLAEHLTVVVYSISKGHLFESGNPEFISIFFMGINYNGNQKTYKTK